MKLKHRPTRWFCVDCGWKAPKRYEPQGCTQCGTTLIRVWITPLQNERAEIEAMIRAHQNPSDSTKVTPHTLNGLLFQLDRKMPLSDAGKVPLSLLNIYTGRP